MDKGRGYVVGLAPQLEFDSGSELGFEGLVVVHVEEKTHGVVAVLLEVGELGLSLLDLCVAVL